MPARLLGGPLIPKGELHSISSAKKPELPAPGCRGTRIPRFLSRVFLQLGSVGLEGACESDMQGL